MSGYLETKNLSVGYHGKPLIEDVSLCVQRGKIVTLIGPNGSGKSTILKTVIGQLPELSGTVYLDGETMRSRSRNDIARRMAILMTVRVEPELMTCRDVVSSGRYPYTGRLGVLRDEDKKIVEQSLSQVDALAFADAPFSAVSDGQRQRILLARALCQQPQLIVLDEPTSFLDIRYKLELLPSSSAWCAKTTSPCCSRSTSSIWRGAFRTQSSASRETASTATARRRRSSRATTSRSSITWSEESTTSASAHWNLYRSAYK
ncbi:MAG: ABC transporter ATP-binding protein [Oscillibacter sp.]